MASNIHPKDMRTWIAELEEAGELIHARELADLIHATLEPGIEIRDRTTGNSISAR